VDVVPRIRARAYLDRKVGSGGDVGAEPHVRTEPHQIGPDPHGGLHHASAGRQVL
jgi:hypothetical protein